MVRLLLIIILGISIPSTVFAQEENEQLLEAYEEGGFTYRDNYDGDVGATNNPDDEAEGSISGFITTPVKWLPYETKCKPCRALVNQYNNAMQDLFNSRAMIVLIEKSRDSVSSEPRTTTPSQTTDAASAAALNRVMAQNELFNVRLVELKENVAQLELTTKNLRRSITKCEGQCAPKGDNKEPLILIPSGTIIEDPEIFIDWKGPYYEVCEDCRKLAAELNDFYQKAIDNVNIVNALEAKIPNLKSQILIADQVYAANRLNRMKQREQDLADGKIQNITQAQVNEDKAYIKYWADEIEKLRKELKQVEKDLKKALKNRDKIKKDFEKTLAKYNECIRKCPPQKNACPFPESSLNSMTIGPNNEVGSSAQAAKEMRDKVTGAAKGAATKALGSLLGFGGLGGGGSSGPKMDKDRSRGDFTRISSGDTDLDIRASWRDDQLIVSTEIDDSPDNGTFHAQWIEDAEGNTYLPVRYMIFKMYRDWKLTVSWTEDHYVNGEHVFHDEGQEITTGRDLLGTWSIFEGAEGIANSIWGMLGFDTAAKGVRHLGAVYDLPPSAFPDDCQMQLVNHISQPSQDPVTTLPIVGNLFKHVDESRKRPETIVLIQPQIIDVEE